MHLVLKRLGMYDKFMIFGMTCFVVLRPQVLELEATGTGEEEKGSEDIREEDELALQPVHSPSSWQSQFEQQRAHILELWDICHVSIIHRTQFYLLFKGDPADAIYMEVELRRLTWLQENMKPDLQCLQMPNTPEEHLLSTPASPASNRLVHSF